MPVPTTYTYETFRDYIEKEVLQNVGKSMGWQDIDVAQYNDIPIVGSKSANSRMLNLTTPLYADVPAGTKIVTTTINGTTGLPEILTTTFDALNGESQILIENAQGAPAYNVNTILRIYTGELDIDAQFAYDAITNETLMMMGFSAPENVPVNEINRFRLMGRIEAWRAVAFNTVTDTDLSFADSTMNRSQMHDYSLNQLDFAEAEYDRLYPFQAPALGKPRAMTYAGGITVRF